MKKIILIIIFCVFYFSNSYTQLIPGIYTSEKTTSILSHGYFVTQDTILKYSKVCPQNDYCRLEYVDEFYIDTLCHTMDDTLIWGPPTDTVFYNYKWGNKIDTLIIKHSISGVYDTLIQKLNTKIDTLFSQYSFALKYPKIYYTDQEVILKTNRRKSLCISYPRDDIFKDMTVSNILFDLNAEIQKESVLMRIDLKGKNNYSLINFYKDISNTIRYQIVIFKYINYELVIIDTQDFQMNTKELKNISKLIINDKKMDDIICPYNNSIRSFELILTQNHRFFTTLECMKVFNIKKRQLQKMIRFIDKTMAK